MIRRPHLLVLNEYYWPGREATAHLLTELSEALVEHFDVTVVTGLLHSPPTEPGRFQQNGVEVIRVRSTAFQRSRLTLRAANYLTYLAASSMEGLRVRRPDVVLAMTDPPIIGVVAVGIAARWRVPVVTVYQDVFPEVAVALHRLDSQPLVATLQVLSRFVLRNSTRVVAIGETMRERLIAKGARAEGIHVIPNWTDVRAIVPQPRDNEWARAHGLLDKFVVMHSGNVGYAQDLDSLVRAATFLRDRKDVVFQIIGSGARLSEIKSLAQRLEVDSLDFLDYLPREILSLSLASADLHVVGLASGLAGFVVPSRTYGILSAGRPLLVHADAESETARIALRAECGMVVPPGRPDRIAAAIRSAADGQHPLSRMGRNARAFVEREGDVSRAVNDYRELLGELVDGTRRAGSP